MGLLSAGECLIDDLHVVESPGTASARELITNGTFESGAGGWRLLGTHDHSHVIVDPADPSNHVLDLVATDSTEHMHNHAETTLAGNYSIVDGRTYQISYRARWVSGSNQLNTRLYFNRLARTTLIDIPQNNGTPARPMVRLRPISGRNTATCVRMWWCRSPISRSQFRSKRTTPTASHRCGCSGP